MAPRILLVDDEIHATDSLRRALRGEGFEILTENSGAAALQRMAARPVDVVVSDAKMPGMDGVELLSRVRKSHPGTVRMMLTGQAELEDAISAINEGEIYRYLTKPIPASELASAIRQALDHVALLRTAAGLLAASRRQSDLLEALERDAPGITRVDRDAYGAIVVSEDPGNLEELRRLAGLELDRAGEILARFDGAAAPVGEGA